MAKSLLQFGGLLVIGITVITIINVSLYYLPDVLKAIYRLVAREMKG